MTLTAGSFGVIDEAGGLLPLLETCISSYRTGLEKAVPIANIDQQLNAQHLLTMAKRISLPEITLLLQASKVREHGLRLARQEQLGEAREALAEARAIGSKAELSVEATEIANSYQAAAEAYWQFRSGDYVAAEDALLGALRGCQKLRDNFLYGVEVRRIHLVRNIVRVRTFANRFDDAAELASRMIRYIQGHRDYWPLQELDITTEPDRCTAEERGLLYDQFLGEIALLLAKYNSARIAVHLRNAGLLTIESADNDTIRIRHCLLSMLAIDESDFRGFLEHATQFFSYGPGQLAETWNRMSKVLVEICDLAPDLCGAVDTLKLYE